MILQLHRDFLKPGCEASFTSMEEQAAQICADMGCPNVHLAMESLTGPKEVWWLTTYESESDKDRVVKAYVNNPALLSALETTTKDKKELATWDEVFAHYKSDLSQGIGWTAAGARFARFQSRIRNRDFRVTATILSSGGGIAAGVVARAG